ncbi:MAG: hypothetical protein Q7U38_03555 [Methylobacter sp.]|nr:hypothetical protein [Methylobacter sp.]
MPRALRPAGAFHLKRDKHAEVDLPGFTTAMDGESAGAAGSGSSKNLEGLSRVKLIASGWYCNGGSMSGSA